eukprot:1740431-Rhodomonas_salina.1
MEETSSESEGGTYQPTPVLGNARVWWYAKCGTELAYGGMRSAAERRSGRERRSERRERAESNRRKGVSGTECTEKGFDLAAGSSRHTAK